MEFVRDFRQLVNVLTLDGEPNSSTTEQDIEILVERPYMIYRNVATVVASHVVSR